MEVRKPLERHYNVWMLEPDDNTLCTTVLPGAEQSKQIDTCYIKIFAEKKSNTKQ